MGRVRALARAGLLIGLLALAACGTAPPPGGVPVATGAEVTALADALAGLDPAVNPEEAARAARIALDTSRQLSVDYGVEDTPIVHNMKVNAGLKPRGLCYQWADDLEARLSQERFATLSLHRAIANHDKPLRVQHSTVILSAAGESMAEGMVLDPWRSGGVLFWAPVAEDTRYDWAPQDEVFRAQLAARERRGAG